jgi:hypothetical protein
MFLPQDFRAGNQVGSTTAQEDLRNTTVDFSRGLSIRVTLCVLIFAKMAVLVAHAAPVDSLILGRTLRMFGRVTIAGDQQSVNGMDEYMEAAGKI